jgi:hypothetical protein
MLHRPYALSLTLLALAAAPLTTLAAADTPDTGPTFTGFVDTTYNFDTNGTHTNVDRSFDSEANSFLLNDAQLKVSGHPVKDQAITYVFSIDYGTDAKAMNAADPAQDAAAPITIEEAYGTWMDAKSKVGVKIGKFVTYEGIEVIESMNNPTISRGLLFSLAEPYTNTGALVTYNPNDKLDVEAGVVNGWDEIAAVNQGKTLLAHAGYNWGDPLSLSLTAMYGTAPIAGNDHDKRLSIDLTGLTKIVKNLALNFQLNYGRQQHAALLTTKAGEGASWFGAAVEPVYTINDKWSIGARLEWLSDNDDALAGAATSKRRLVSVSVAPALQVTAHFLARVEGRFDSSNQDDFTNKSGTGKKNQGELLAESIFSF